MIIFGNRTKTVSGPEVKGPPCSHCGEFNYSAFGAIRYFHIFWIPVFPTSRKLGLECRHCKRTALGKDVPEMVAGEVRSSVFTRGAMLPTFSGAIIIALLFGFGYYTVRQDAAEDHAFVLEPMVNDLYILDETEVFDSVDTDYKYGVMRVVSVGDSDIQVNPSNYNFQSSVISASELAEAMDQADFFATETMSIGRTDLVDLQQRGVIRDVRRSGN